MDVKEANVFVTEYYPRVELAVELLKNFARVTINKSYTGRVSSKDIRHVDGIIAGDSKIIGQSIAKARRLRVIGRAGTGVDNIDLEACTKRGIIVFNTPGLNIQSVAEQAIGMTIAVMRKFKQLDILVRSGRWNEGFCGTNELWHKTLGIIGFGNIGRRVAALAEAFGMHILVYDPYTRTRRSKRAAVRFTGLETLMRESDVVSIHCPLTEETEGMIGESELRLMKRAAIIINAARGGIVVEEDLYNALVEGRIAGAGLDVLENEPVNRHPLFGLDNVLITPHTAGNTFEANERMTREACKGIIQVFKGKLPDNIVNRAAIAKIR